MEDDVSLVHGKTRGEIQNLYGNRELLEGLLACNDANVYEGTAFVLIHLVKNMPHVSLGVLAKIYCMIDHGHPLLVCKDEQLSDVGAAVFYCLVGV